MRKENNYKEWADNLLQIFNRLGYSHNKKIEKLRMTSALLILGANGLFIPYVAAPLFKWLVPNHSFGLSKAALATSAIVQAFAPQFVYCLEKVIGKRYTYPLVHHSPFLFLGFAGLTLNITPKVYLLVVSLLGIIQTQVSFYASRLEAQENKTEFNRLLLLIQKGPLTEDNITRIKANIENPFHAEEYTDLKAKFETAILNHFKNPETTAQELIPYLKYLTLENKFIGLLEVLVKSNDPQYFREAKTMSYAPSLCFEAGLKVFRRNKEVTLLELKEVAEQLPFFDGSRSICYLQFADTEGLTVEEVDLLIPFFTSNKVMSESFFHYLIQYEKLDIAQEYFINVKNLPQVFLIFFRTFSPEFFNQEFATMSSSSFNKATLQLLQDIHSNIDSTHGSREEVLKKSILLCTEHKVPFDSLQKAYFEICRDKDVSLS